MFLEQENDNKQYDDDTFNINNLNLTSDPKDSKKDDFDTPMGFMSKDAKEEMK